MLAVTVNRLTWIRGGSEESYLLSETGNKCCMGFASIAAGLSPEVIQRRLTIQAALVGFPHQRAPGEKTYTECPASLQAFVDDDNVSDKVYEANDDAADVADDGETREQTLIRLGAEVGIAFTFVDGDAPPIRYRMLFRPLMFATYPGDVTTEWVELPQDGVDHGAFPGVPVSRHVFGVFTTNRQLTAAELDSYQIVIVAE